MRLSTSRIVLGSMTLEEESTGSGIENRDFIDKCIEKDDPYLLTFAPVCVVLGVNVRTSTCIRAPKQQP